jgi:hypothetical protein
MDGVRRTGNRHTLKIDSCSLIRAARPEERERQRREDNDLRNKEETINRYNDNPNGE